MDGYSSEAAHGFPGQELASLLNTLAVVGVSPRERFEVLLRQGFRPTDVLLAVLGSLTGERVRDSWPRVDVAEELLSACLITLPEAAEALRKIGIHPMSLLGVGWCRDEIAKNPMSEQGMAETLGVPFDLTGKACSDPSGGIVMSAFQALWSLPSGVKTENLILEQLPLLHTIEEGVEVSKLLGIRRCRALRALPGSIDNVSSISITSCDSLEELRLHRVAGNIHIEDCRGFSSLPGPLEVGGSLKLTGLPQLKELGPRIRIVHDVHLSALPDRFQVPEDLQVGGRILIKPPRGCIGVPKRLSEKVWFV